MFEQVPEEAEGKMMALVNFLRVACTTTDADGSAAGVESALVNQDQSDQVFEWCRGLHNQYYRPVQGAVAQGPRGREVAAVTASPPAGVNHLAEYAAMVAAAIDSSHVNAGEAGKKSKFSLSFVEEYAEITGIEDPDKIKRRLENT